MPIRGVSRREGMRARRSVLVGMMLVLVAAGRDARALDPAKAVTQFGHDLWQLEQGLPQNTVFALTQTKDGYVWLGTAEGLVRFDGVSFTVFSRRNTPELRNNVISSLLETRDGALWVGTDGGGLVRLKDGLFRSYGKKEGLSSLRIASLLQDRTGQIWVGTFESGLNRWRNGSFEVVTKKDGLSDDRVRALSEDADGTLWIGTDGGGINLLKNGKVMPLPLDRPLSSNHVRALAFDRAGTLWAGTFGGGVNVVKNGHVRVLDMGDGLSSNSVTSLHEDREGGVWIGTYGGGLNRIHGGKVESLRVKDGLSSDYICSLAEDREGSLWIGTVAGGLNRIREGKLSSFTKQEGLPSDSVRALTEDRDGAIWVGTEGGGVSRFEGGRFKTFTTENGLLDNGVYSVLCDEDNSLWIGGYGSGLNRLKDGRLATFLPPVEGMLGGIHVLASDGRGALWIGTFRDGLYRYVAAPDPAGQPGRLRGTLTPFTSREGLSSEKVLSIKKDHLGIVWVGTAGGGLNRIENGRFTEFPGQDQLRNEFVYAIHEDAEGVLWIGTSGSGLGRLKGGKLTYITSKDGLFDDVFLGIVQDDGGDLWFTCNKGISRAKLADLNAFAERRIPRVSVTPYGVADGMKSSECNSGGQPAFKSRDGRLWFATIKGFVVIDPRRIPMNAVIPPVLIEDVLIEDVLSNGRRDPASGFGPAHPLVEAPRLTFPAGSEKFEFHYTALSFLGPEHVRFRYKLDGLDSSWTEAGTRRVAYYNRIPHGTYHFRVIGCNNDGLWNERGGSVTVSVLPHFWETIWFYVLSVGLASALLAGAVSLRVRQMKAREQHLVSVVHERTAEVEEALRKEGEARRDSDAQKVEAERLRALADRERSRAEEANAAKSSFLANTSHELRTPLNAIIGYSELLEEEALERNQAYLIPDLRRIHSAARHQLGLINTLLDLSKIEAGKMDLLVEKFQVSEVVREVMGIIEPLARQNANDLVAECSEDAGWMVSDQTKLRQCLLNLLSNACKFTEEGRISLRVTREPREGSPWLRFRVSDSGRGMPPEFVSRLFQPFTQADASTTRKYGGTGLGLVITRKFCQLMGGEIEVLSEVGSGTSFSILLPVALGSDGIGNPRVGSGEFIRGSFEPRNQSKS